MSVPPVDLRSDTVTRPTPEMFEAMRIAPLGDDVLGDDPTVHRLEELAAETVGMQAAVFVPSGSMGNQIALATHCRRGDSALFEEQAHMVYYEAGAPAVVAQVVARSVPSDNGLMRPSDVEARILKRSYHTPGTSVISVENTHNRAGGAVVPVTLMSAYRDIADRHDIKLHLDGARIFNAAVALQVGVQELTRHAHSVSFCLSKGLRSPVGSVLCGNAEFIEEARYWRKRLGGGMRQAGLLAACGIVSLTRYVDRLAEDHARAKTLGRALSEVAGLHVDFQTIQTNMVMVDTAEPAANWVTALRDLGILTMAFGERRLRLVLHADVDDEGLSRAIDAFRRASLSPGSAA